MRGALASAAVIAALAAAAPAALAGGTTLAVIGDTPYGPAQLEAFPELVEDVNRDADVELVLHLGDIKTGSSVCSDDYFQRIRGLFDTFSDPLVYTPGDNEWTDCHRAAAGGFIPTERLAVLRQTFYPQPGRTLGEHSRRVATQADVPGFEPFVENTLWTRERVVFSTVHAVGSNNGLAPWFGSAETPEQRTERLAEYDGRLGAALAWLDETFALAQRRQAPAVVIGMQADMWEANAVAAGEGLEGFDAIVQRLADLAAAFGKPVLVLQGDSHRYLVDRPLVEGSPAHGVTTEAPNVLRIVVEGETASEWLRLDVDGRSPGVFSFEREGV